MLSDSPFSTPQRNEVIDLIDNAIEHASGNMTKGDGKSQANPFFFNYLTDTDWRSLAADVPMATKMKLMVSICLDRLGMLYPNEETDNIILATIVLAAKSEPQPQQWYRWLQDWKSVKSADRKTLPDKTLLMRSYPADVAEFMKAHPNRFTSSDPPVKPWVDENEVMQLIVRMPWRRTSRFLRSVQLPQPQHVHDSSMVGGSMGMPSGSFNPMMQMAAAFMQQMQRRSGQQHDVDITMHPHRNRAPSPPLALTGGDPLTALTGDPTAVMALENQAEDVTPIRPQSFVQSPGDAAPRDGNAVQLPRKRTRPEPLSGDVNIDDLLGELTKSRQASAARASDEVSEPEGDAPSQSAARPRTSSHVGDSSGGAIATIMKRPAAKPPTKAKAACTDPAETLDAVKRRLGFIKGDV